MKIAGPSDRFARLAEYGWPVCLHVNSFDEIMVTLEAFVIKLRSCSTVTTSHPTRSFELISHATAAAPNRLLSKQNSAMLSELFGSIKELEKGTRSEDGQQKILNHLEPGSARDVIDFWEDEWLV